MQGAAAGRRRRLTLPPSPPAPPPSPFLQQFPWGKVSLGFAAAGLMTVAEPPSAGCAPAVAAEVRPPRVQPTIRLVGVGTLAMHPALLPAAKAPTVGPVCRNLVGCSWLDRPSPRRPRPRTTPPATRWVLPLLACLGCRCWACLGQRLLGSVQPAFCVDFPWYQSTCPTLMLRHSPPLLGAQVVFVLGGPGSGKGTQSARLVEEFGVAHLRWVLGELINSVGAGRAG